MRTILLFIVLAFMVNIGFGQVINFTDVNFKNKLLSATQGGWPVIAKINFGTTYSQNTVVDTNEDGEIQLSEAAAINYLDVTGANISDMTDLAYFPNLIFFNCATNNITILDLSVLPLLKYFSCPENQISNLDFSSLNFLQSAQCSDNLVSTLDFSHNSALISIGCGNNPNLSFVNVKNGSYQTFMVGFSWDDGCINTPNLAYFCADEFEVPDLVGYLEYAHPGGTVAVNTYCSFTPGGTFYTIQGTSKYDSNNNGCDAMDASVPFMKINVTDGTVSGSVIAKMGNYTIPVQAGSYTLTPVIQQPNYFNISPATATVAFPTTASPHTQDFCVTANGVHNDLEVTILSFGIAAGSDAQYGIVYKNNGTATQSGTVNFAFDDNVLNFVSASPTVDNQSTNNLNWNFSNLLPFESREVLVTLNANAPTATPPLNLGDIVTSTATITASTDETPADNVFVLNQTVVNSFDPNDKTCLEGNSIVPAKVGEYVHYMIRFENNGTANAQNIVVKDLIDTTKFDIDSLFPISGSHNFTTRINGNAVEFVFQNINLSFAAGINDGYIAFKIKTKSTLILGNSFSNSANIYFDYNLPIVTNTATTTVANPLVNTDFVFSNNFSLYPNPVKNTLNITNKNKLDISSISIYNTLGQLVHTITNPTTTNDVSGLKSGTYFIKMVTDKGFSSGKFVKE
jgi:hypothetical protein